MQRYRNNRRKSTTAKLQKLPGVQLPPVARTKPTIASSESTKEIEAACQESIEALQKLFEGKAFVPHTVIQNLLDETLPHRNEWLSGHDI